MWGSIEVEPALNFAAPEIQSIMSLGLEVIHKIATAKTYAARHELLDQRNGPDRTNRFLYHALRHYQWSPPQRQSVKAQGRDCDSGPQVAWEWTYGHSSTKAYNLDRSQLRSWGYVMWDKARLEKVSLFNAPFRPLHVAEAHEVHAEFEASWRARLGIARVGGTKYWSRTDQSQTSSPSSRRIGPTFANAKREFGAASARIGAAMDRKNTIAGGLG